MRRTIVNPPRVRPTIREVYSDCGVLDAPPDLPDGEYTVRIGNQFFSTKLEQGVWSATGSPSLPALLPTEAVG